ncbi:hypothetical protein CR513_59436, partial [Mucuna pruriens]
MVYVRQEWIVVIGCGLMTLCVLLSLLDYETFSSNIAILAFWPHRKVSFRTLRFLPFRLQLSYLGWFCNNN